MVQRKSGHVTLLDIAQACGYSVSTVSIVLSEAPLSQNVAASTREQIRKMARHLGYHPDAYARSLRRRRSQTIAVLAYDLSDPFCIPIVHGIQAGLHPASYLPLLVDAQTQRKLFDNYLRMILERRAEGVIVIASWIFQETNLLDDIEKNQVPIVIVGRDLTNRNVSSLFVDNEAGGALAMRHLIELGHRHIAIVRGPRNSSTPNSAGQACSAQPQRPESRSTPSSSSSFPTSPIRPLALKAVSISQARCLPRTPLHRRAGLRRPHRARSRARPQRCRTEVPEDCSVVGFDDVLPAAVSTPGITTVHQPLKEMGLLASEWTLQAINAREQQSEKPVQLYNAPPELIVRMSTARCPCRTEKQTET